MKNEFKREMTKLNVWSLMFGCIIGWGAFIMPGTTFLPVAGPIGTAIGMLIGALIMIIISFSYSYMMKIYPECGGEVNFTKKCFDETHGYICGWFLLLAYITNIPMNCIALNIVINKIFNNILQFGNIYSIFGYNIYCGEILLSFLILFIITILNIVGIKKTSIVQTIVSCTLITTFVLILFMCICNPSFNVNNFNPLFGQNNIINGILYIIAISPWAYVGFDTIPQACQEFNFSVKKVNFIMFLAILFGSVVYIGNNFIASGLNSDWIHDIKSNDWLLAQSIKSTIGFYGFLLLSISVMCAIISGILGFTTVSSRLLYSMSKNKYLPDMFGKIHFKYRTPVFSIIFIILISIILILFGKISLNCLCCMSSIGVCIAFVYTTLSCFKTIKNQKIFNCYNIITMILSLIGLLFSISFILLLLIPGLPTSFNIQCYIMLLVWIIIGFILYKRYKK